VTVIEVVGQSHKLRRVLKHPQDELETCKAAVKKP